MCKGDVAKVTVAPPAPLASDGSTASNIAGIPRGRSVMTRSQRAAIAAAKLSTLALAKQDQTATLTNIKEEAVDGGVDAEMEDAEKLLTDIDSKDTGNTLAVTEYIADIYGWYGRAEVSRQKVEGVRQGTGSHVK